MMTVWEYRSVFRHTGTPDSRIGPRSMKELVRFFSFLHRKLNNKTAVAALGSCCKSVLNKNFNVSDTFYYF
jgi:hypothetical protein